MVLPTVHDVLGALQTLASKGQREATYQQVVDTLYPEPPPGVLVMHSRHTRYAIDGAIELGMVRRDDAGTLSIVALTVLRRLHPGPVLTDTSHPGDQPCTALGKAQHHPRPGASQAAGAFFVWGRAATKCSGGGSQGIFL